MAHEACDREAGGQIQTSGGGGSIAPGPDRLPEAVGPHAPGTGTSSRGKNSRTWAPNVLVSIGFAMYPRHPARRASSRSPGIAWAVNATIGIRSVAGGGAVW